MWPFYIEYTHNANWLETVIQVKKLLDIRHLHELARSNHIKQSTCNYSS